MSETLSLPGIATTTRRWPSDEGVKLLGGRVVRIRNTLVTTSEQLATMVRVLSAMPRIIYDSETSGLTPALGAQIVGHALGVRASPDFFYAWYCPVRHSNDRSITQLSPETVAWAIADICATPGDLGFHHAKFDTSHLRADGVARFVRRKIDSSIRATIANENEPKFGLKPLAKRYVTADATEEQDEVYAWMRKDAAKLGVPFKQRRRGEEDDQGEPTYMERFGLARVPIVLCGSYACRDVFYTGMLLEHFEWTETAFGPLHAREHEVSEALHDMEWGGLPLNVDEVRRSQVAAQEECGTYLGIIHKYTGQSFEVNDANVRDLLFNKLKLPPPKLTKGGKQAAKVAHEAGEDVEHTTSHYAADKEVREILAAQHPEHRELILALTAYARAQKIATTYTSSLLRYYSAKTGSIHPSYNQLEARDEGGVPVTGRLSSSEPNIQNQASKAMHLAVCGCDDCVKKWAKGEIIGPERKAGPTRSISVRRYFYVPKGYVRAYIDFSQIELRILAWLSRDPVLLDAYARDLDIHSITAEQVTGGDRFIAKQVNFGNCLPADTMVITKRGELPIQDVRVGDRVLTHRKNWKAVTGKQSRSRAELVEIVTSTGRVLRSTPEHMWLVQFPSANGKPLGRGWVRADEIEVGRYMVYHGATWGRETQEVDGCLARALGWWISEGSFSDHVGMRIGQDRKANPLVVAAMRPLLKRLGFRTWQDGSMQRWGLSREFAQGAFGKHVDLYAKSATKGLPYRVLDWTEYARRILVAGLWEGDGSTLVTKGARRNVSYCSTSPLLRQQLVKLLDSLGINARDDDEKTVRVLGSESIARFLEIIPTVKAKAAKRYMPKKVFVAQERIVSVRPVKLAAEIDVFDIEVADDHSFIADGVVSHNSYGMTEIGLARRMPGYALDPEGTREKAKKVLVAFFGTYAGIPRFRASFADHMRQRGGVFVSSFGRPRRIPDINSRKQWERERAERMMMSSIVSGTAADLAKEVMIGARRWLKQADARARLCQQVHDELVYDLPIDNAGPLLSGVMHITTTWPMFENAGVPIRANVSIATEGSTWEAKKEALLINEGRSWAFK